MKKTSFEGRWSSKLIKAEKTLIQELKAKGYDVFVGLSKYAGLPTSILVVGEFPGQELKADFYEIAEGQLSLKWFRSGEAYIETP